MLSYHELISLFRLLLTALSLLSLIQKEVAPLSWGIKQWPLSAPKYILYFNAIVLKTLSFGLSLSHTHRVGLFLQILDRHSVRTMNKLGSELHRRRRRMSRIAFGKLQSASNDPQLLLKTKVHFFNNNVLPVMSCSCQSWNTIVAKALRLRVTQKAIERYRGGHEGTKKKPSLSKNCWREVV